MQQQAVEALVRTIKTLVQKNLVLLHKTNTIIITQVKKQPEIETNTHNLLKQEEWATSKQVMEQILQFTKIQHYKSFTNYIKAVANTHRLKYPHGQKFNLKRIYHKGRTANQRLFLITIPKQYLQFNMTTSQQQAQQKYFNTAENSENFQSMSQEIEIKQQESLNQIESNHRKDSEISLQKALKQQRQHDLEQNISSNFGKNIKTQNQQKINIEQSRNILTKKLQQLMSQENYDQTEISYHQTKNLISQTIAQLLSFYKANSEKQFEGRQQQKLQIYERIMQKITSIYDRMGDNIQKIDQILNVSMNPQSILFKKQKDTKYESVISLKDFKELDVKKQNQQRQVQNNESNEVN